MPLLKQLLLVDFGLLFFCIVSLAIPLHIHLRNILPLVLYDETRKGLSNVILALNRHSITDNIMTIRTCEGIAVENMLTLSNKEFCLSMHQYKSKNDWVTKVLKPVVYNGSLIKNAYCRYENSHQKKKPKRGQISAKNGPEVLQVSELEAKSKNCMVDYVSLWIPSAYMFSAHAGIELKVERVIAKPFELLCYADKIMETSFETGPKNPRAVDGLVELTKSEDKSNPIPSNNRQNVWAFAQAHTCPINIAQEGTVLRVGDVITDFITFEEKVCKCPSAHVQNNNMPLEFLYTDDELFAIWLANKGNGLTFKPDSQKQTANALFESLLCKISALEEKYGACVYWDFFPNAIVLLAISLPCAPTRWLPEMKPGKLFLGSPKSPITCRHVYKRQDFQATKHERFSVGYNCPFVILNMVNYIPKQIGPMAIGRLLTFPPDGDKSNAFLFSDIDFHGKLNWYKDLHCKFFKEQDVSSMCPRNPLIDKFFESKCEYFKQRASALGIHLAVRGNTNHCLLKKQNRAKTDDSLLMTINLWQIIEPGDLIALKMLGGKIQRPANNDKRKFVLLGDIKNDHMFILFETPFVVV